MSVSECNIKISEIRDDEIYVSPDVCLLLSRGYAGARQRARRRAKIESAQLNRLEDAAREFAAALADITGTDVWIRTNDLPTGWSGDWEPEAFFVSPVRRDTGGAR